MRINAKIKYQEEYFPTNRHRIPRIREVEETVPVSLREIKKENAPVAMVVSDYRSYLDAEGNDQFGLCDIPYVAFENHLYCEKRDMRGALDEGPYTLEMFMKQLDRAGDFYFGTAGNGKEDVLKSLHEFVSSHLLIDGIFYEEKGEPRYVVQTFGLGHNHGGTALFITNRYNENIGRDCYFSALDRDKAIAYANEIAAARGDTDYVGKFGEHINIQVYIPQMVRCVPQVEHGEGNSLLKSFEECIRGSGSAMDAGLLVLSNAANEIAGSKLPLSEQIQSASSRSAGSSAETVSPDKHTHRE